MAQPIPPNIDLDPPRAWRPADNQVHRNDGAWPPRDGRVRANQGQLEEGRIRRPDHEQEGRPAYPEGFALPPPAAAGIGVDEILQGLVVIALAAILLAPAFLAVRHYHQVRLRRARVARSIADAGTRLRKGASDLIRSAQDSISAPIMVSHPKPPTVYAAVETNVVSEPRHQALTPPRVCVSTDLTQSVPRVPVGPANQHHLIEDRIYTMACENPAWCPGNIASWLNRRGADIRSTDVESVLRDLNLDTESQRMLNTELLYLDGAVLLTSTTIQMLQSFNPCLTERDVAPSRPGELIAHDIMSVNPVRGQPSVCLHILVDTFSSYAFIATYAGKWPSHAASVVRDHVVPEYEARGIAINTVLTPKHDLFWGKGDHPYVVCLRQLGIRQLLTYQRPHGNSAYLHRFRKTLEREFLRPKGNTRRFVSMDEFESELDAWLYAYNHSRPHVGYPNMGEPPATRMPSLGTTD